MIETSTAVTLPSRLKSRVFVMETCELKLPSTAVLSARW